MLDKTSRPRWALLYLALPLAALLFWLIARAHLSGAMRELSEMGAVLFVWGYIGVWRRVNMVALMHQAPPGLEEKRLYRVWEALPGRRAPETRTPGPVAALGTFYSDLFTAPVTVWAPEPEPAHEEAHVEDAA